MDESASEKKPREFWIQNPNTINQTATDVSVYDEEVNPSITEEIHVREVLEGEIMAPIFSNIRSDSQLELEQLRLFKKEATNVIEFYADEKHWDDRIISDLDYSKTQLHDACGGKRARAFRAKFGEQK